MKDKYKHVQPDEYGEYDWSFFDEVQENIKLPKRKDYTYVEEFQDYEFTQCIVYEIAVRNPRYKEEIAYVIQFYTKHKKDIDKLLKNKPPLNSKKRNRLYLLSELKRLINNIEILAVNFEENTLNYKDEKNFEKNIYKLIEKIIEKKSNINLKKSKPIIDQEYIKEGDGFSIKTNIYLDSKNPMHLLPSDVDERKKIIKSRRDKRIYTPGSPKEYLSLHTQYIEKYSSEKVSDRLHKKSILGSSVKILENFKRPALRLDKSLSQNIILEIDLSKSEKEIIAYVKHVKKFINKKNTYLSATDLFMLVSTGEKGKETTKITNDKKITKASIFADMFFIYDYLKTLVNANEKYNDKLKKNLQDKEEIIKNANNITLNHSKLIKKAKNHFKKNMAKTAIYKLCDDTRAKEIGISKGTMLKYYNTINSYLIDEKYKNLINTIIGDVPSKKEKTN